MNSISTTKIESLIEETGRPFRIPFNVTNLLNTSSLLGGILILLLAIPLFVVFIVIGHLAIPILRLKVRKGLADIDNEIATLTFDEAIQARKLMILFEVAIENASKNALFKNIVTIGLYGKIIRFARLFTGVKEKLEATLFVDVSKQPPLTEKEKQAYEQLNEIWGDDEDGTYARMTHSHLKKQTGEKKI